MTVHGSSPGEARADGAPMVMPCMEVRGGNQAVDCEVVMSGLDAWLYSRPFGGEAGGGDVHYVSSCATGRVTRLLVADISGHGAAVADMGSKLRQLMHRYVNALDQTRFVVDLNREFGALAGEGRFATSVVGTFFAPTNRLTLSNAGHLPPLLYRARDRSWSLLTGTTASSSLPLGVLEASQFGQDDVQLSVGDLVVFYTDSLTEAQGPDGRMLGPTGLLELAAELDTSEPAGLIPALLGRIAALHEGNLQRDDVTVLLVRPNGLAPRVPLSRRLSVPWRLARAFVRSLRRSGPRMSWPQWGWANIGGYFFQPLNKLWTRRNG